MISKLGNESLLSKDPTGNQGRHDIHSWTWQKPCAALLLTIEVIPVQMSFYTGFRILAEKAMAPTPVLLPGKSHGRRSLVGCSPWGCKESDTTEQLHFHFSLLCTGEGNSNPLQCSCLENPKDGGASWAAVYGVAQSRTWLSDLAAAAAGGFWLSENPGTGKNHTAPEISHDQCNTEKNFILRARCSVQFSSVQFSESCLTLCDPMDGNMLGFPVHHQFIELVQIRIPQASEVIQPSYPLWVNMNHSLALGFYKPEIRSLSLNRS